MKSTLSLIAPLALITLLSCELPAKPVPLQISKPTILHTHEFKDLEKFYLGKIEFKETDFKASVKHLKNHYLTTCKQTAETPLPLEIKIKQPKQSTPISSRKLSITLEGTFDNILNQLCAIHDIQLEKQENNYVCSAKKSSDEKSPVTYKIIVPPDLNLEDKDNSNPTSIKNLKLIAGNDEIQIQRDQVNSTLTITGDHTSATRVKNFINSINAKIPLQTKILTKIISFEPKNEPIPLEIKKPQAQGILNEAETQFFYRAASQLKGTDISTLPSIVTRNSEQATIEIIRETTNPKSFLGHQLKSKPNVSGLSIILEHQLTYHKTGNMTFSKLGDTGTAIAKDKPIKIQKYKTNFKLTARSKHTHILKVDIPDSKKEHYLLIQPTIIDATGNVDPFR